MARLKNEPDNADGWAMLARSYSRLGRHTEAVPTFAKAVALRADDARLLAGYADTLAVPNNRSIEGEPLKLVLRATTARPCCRPCACRCTPRWSSVPESARAVRQRPPPAT